MMRRTLQTLTLAGLAAVASALWTGAGAVVICSSPTPNPADITCTTTGLTDKLNLEQGVLSSGAHQETFTFDEVSEERRTEGWFLGNPAIRSCRFCLDPNRQNMARKRELDRLRAEDNQ